MAFKSCCYFVGWDWSPFAGKMMLWQVFSNVFFCAHVCVPVVCWAMGATTKNANVFNSNLEKNVFFLGGDMLVFAGVYCMYLWFRYHPVVSPWQSVGPMKREAPKLSGKMGKFQLKAFPKITTHFFTGHEDMAVLFWSFMAIYGPAGPYQL